MISAQRRFIKRIKEEFGRQPGELRTRDIAKLRERVEVILEKMTESDKEPVLEGLHQPSERGQKNYLMKILSEAGLIPDNDQSFSKAHSH